MKKRIFSFALACVMLFGSDGIIYAAETAGDGTVQEADFQEESDPVEEESEDLQEDPSDTGEESALLSDQEQTLQEETEDPAESVAEEEETEETESAAESETENTDMSDADPVVIETENVSRLGSEKPVAPVLTMTGCRYDYVNLSWKALELPEEDSGYYIYSIENGTAKIIAEFERTAQGYTIYGYTNGVKNAESSGSVGNLTTLSYQEKNVVHNKTYQFQVAAYVDKSTQEQIGDLSNVVTATPKIEAPVMKSAVEQSYNTAVITWQTTNDSPDGYEVYRKADGESSYQKIATVKTGSYTDKTLTVGTKYYYRVRSVKTLSGGSTIYSEYTSAKSVKTTLTITTMKAASASYTSITVSWGKVSGANSYDIYRSTSKNGKYTKLATIPSGTTVKYTDKKLTTGKTYYYKVRACFSSGKTKVYSSYS